MSKNRIDQVLSNVTITDFAAEGKCIYKADDRVIFVEGNVAPGDVVDLQVVRRKKSFYEAVVLRHHKYSDYRVNPYCSHFGTCGGCKWQHIAYEEQLRYKAQQVQDHFRRIGHIEGVAYEPILAAPQTTLYRNKLEFTFTNKRWLTKEEIGKEETRSDEGVGFHVPKRFDKVFQVETCHLQPEPSNEIRDALFAFAVQNKIPCYDLKQNQGVLRNLVIRTSTLGECMVIVQFGEANEATISLVMNFLRRRFEFVTSLYYIINTKGNDSYQDQEPVLFAGEKYLREQMDDLTFWVGPKSFYQTNSRQAKVLYQTALDYADLSGTEIVYDLYTGTGTIANFVARKAQKVVGIEYIPEAIEDAHFNALQNKITNTFFVAGDMKRVLNEDFIRHHGRPDVVITDPPRAGMDVPVIETILAAAPSKIVYVSCNTATQARDLALLKSAYHIVKTRPVDMFPNTHHIENVTLLEKR